MPREFLLDVSVQCETCMAWDHLFVRRHLHKLTAEATSEAVKRGWTWKRSRGWHCPKHSEEAR